MRTKSSLVTIIIFLIFALALWLAFLALPQPAEVRLADAYGEADLLESDFSNTIYIYRDYWDSYPEKLYTPEDFDNGKVTESPQQLESEDYGRINYATHRLRVKLQPGKTYTLLMKTPDYSMRLYIDGELVDTVGNPADNKEDTIPRTAMRMYALTPETETTDIVAQSANWVHREGAYSPVLRIGTVQNINNYENRDLIISFLIIGGLLTAFLYHLGLFALNRNRKRVLVFAFCCLLLALLNGKLLLAFFPNYNWYVALAVEYIVHSLTFAMLVLFLNMMFRRLYNKYVVRAYFIMAGVFIVLTCVLPPEVYSNLLIIFDGASVLMIAYTIVRLCMRMKDKKLQSLLALIGISLVCLFGVNDILYQNNIYFIGSIAGQAFATPIAMLFFVFCYGLVISIDYAETEQKMLAAERKVREAEERYNALLEKQNDIPPHTRPEDFKLSRRETDVLWLLLDGKSRQEIADTLFISMGTVNTYCTRIYQKTNCKGVFELRKLFGLN